MRDTRRGALPQGRAFVATHLPRRERSSNERNRGNGLLVNLWFEWLNLPKRDAQWHRQDVADEVQELRDASGLVEVWSEKADVVFATRRGRWAGHGIELPLRRLDSWLGLAYMFPKYTLRWLFYRTVGHHLDPALRISEVRNPRKTDKLRDIARNNGFDPVAFERECRRCSAWWLFLK